MMPTSAAQFAAVELKLAHPAKPKGFVPGSAAWLNEPVSSLYLTLTAPEKVIAALNPQS
jgi:hypothetical protein